MRQVVIIMIALVLILVAWEDVIVILKLATGLFVVMIIIVYLEVHRDNEENGHVQYGNGK